MTAAPDPRPRDAGTGPSGVRRTAWLSPTTFDAALDALVARDGEDALVDLRADAYGHGAVEVERRARERGIHRFLRTAADARHVTPQRLIEPYGLLPGSTPVLRLTGEVIAVKRVPAGTAVSYGYTYRTRGEATLALVGLGYADGVPRLASSRAPVRVGAATGVVAGRVAMDQLVVDLGEHATGAQAGDDAVLWDDAATLSAWAAATDRAPEALTAGLGRRIQRRWGLG